MNTDKDILLSICIPTYNRAKVLNRTLATITSDEAFDEEVELIISDNCSPDNTREIVETYARQYPNVHYYRNETNIKDRNFTKVLSYGKGEYLKLQNDYLAFNAGSLQYIKDRLRENRKSRVPVFFTGDHVYTRKKNKVIRCDSLDEYVQAVSTFVTFSSCFGAWREQFEALEDKDHFAELMLLQVDWTYRLVLQQSGPEKCIVYDEKVYKMSPVSLGIRQGYNYFGVQIDNYYRIMLPHIIKGYISRKTYFEDRKYSLYHFSSKIFHAYIWPKKTYQFDTSNAFNVLWKYYRNVPMFYLFLFLYPFLLVLKPVYFCTSQVSRFKGNNP